MKPTGPEEKADASGDKDARIAALEAQLEHARQDMHAFSYSVSHDLRAPLRAIDGFARILGEDYSTKLDPEARRFLQHVIQNAQIMGALIEGLLNFHRLGEKPVNKTRVNMTQLVREVISALPKPPKLPEIRIPELPTIFADPALIRAAWDQLISNALKFSKRHSAPVIEFGSKETDSEQIVWVKDNGIGFDMRYADKLFQMFQKLQKDPEFEGHGVGLALVRRAVEKQDGRVWAEGAPNEGATFFVAMPK